MEFTAFPKIARLNRDIIITEKIDGTNASIYIGENGTFFTGSRTHWITPDSDNFGFSLWASKNKEELLRLGPGHHFGEWWGVGIQRNYQLSERRFSLFKPIENLPMCCRVVPVLYQGPFITENIEHVLTNLAITGSQAEPGYMNPEGIVIFHTASRMLFKKTIKEDETPKGAR
jgi:hypothetical protein